MILKKVRLVILLFLVLILASSISMASATQITVGKDLGNATINAAIANASDGDIILVKDGVYSENVVVDKQVTIISENGSANTIVQSALSNAAVFRISADDVQISGFNITGATNYNGIFIISASGCSISDNEINGNSNGIVLHDSNYNQISNNIFSANTNNGIHLQSSSHHNTISNNNVVDNNHRGIYLGSSNNNTLSGNIVSSNTDSGIYITGSDDTTFIGNTVNYNGNYGIYIRSSNNNHLLDNTASSNTYSGIYVESSEHNILTGNTADLNTYSGIQLQSSNCTVSDNTVNENNNGIFLRWGSNNLLSNNTADYNVYGIYLDSSGKNDLTENTAKNNYVGIKLWYSDSNTLSDNIVDINSRAGILLERADSNELRNNSAYNTTGDYEFYDLDNSEIAESIELTSSAEAYGIACRYSDNNELINNRAIGNEGYGFYSEDSENVIVNHLILTKVPTDVSFVTDSLIIGLIGSETSYVTPPMNGTNLNGYVTVIRSALIPSSVSLDYSELEDMDIDFFYNDSEMSEENESSVTLFMENETGWTEVQGTELNAIENYVSASISDSGIFGLFKDADNSEPVTPSEPTPTTKPSRSGSSSQRGNLTIRSPEETIGAPASEGEENVEAVFKSPAQSNETSTATEELPEEGTAEKEKNDFGYFYWIIGIAIVLALGIFIVKKK